MSFADAQVLLAGLFKMELPTTTVRLCDGAFVKWGAERFVASHDDFGVIEQAEPIDEGVGTEAPGGLLTLLPAKGAAAATISQPTFQGSRMRFWIAEVDPMTSAVVGEPEQIADLMLDRVELQIAKGVRKLQIEFVSFAERFFIKNEGNVLSSRFHQQHFPGELGFDNAVGIGTAVPWGAEAPPRGYVYGGGGGGGNRYLALNDRFGLNLQ